MRKTWNKEEKLQFESALQAKGFQAIAGVDEVGRGPLAGPVVCAAVIMPLGEEDIIVGIDDSKKISEKKRDAYKACEHCDCKELLCRISNSFLVACAKLFADDYR